MIVIHAADLHIDSPLVGLDRYPGCPADLWREATRRAFDNVVSLCQRERAGLLLLAGDVFDGDWRDYNSGLYLHAALSRLAECGTEVAVVRGNHDAANEMTRSLRLPGFVHTFSATEAETRRYERLGVAVHGMSYPVRDVTDDLVPRYPAALAGLFNVGLLHANVGGRPGHAAYAPTSTSTLAARGYDYWALGHVHEHAILAREPYVVYPGNTQGRSVREVGPRGCMRLDLDDTTRSLRSLARVEVDAARWAHLVVTLGPDDGVDALHEAVSRALTEAVRAAGGRPLAARVEVDGATRRHARIEAEAEGVAQQIRADAQTLGGAVWVEKVRLRTRPEGADRGLTGPVGREVARLLAELRADPDARTAQGGALAEELATILALVRRQDHEPAELDVPDPRSEAALARALDGAERLLARALDGGAA